MSLLKLPPEILIQIFGHVGSSYFRSDLSRLTVCKHWSEFALTACFRHFYATQKTLERLLSSQHVESSQRLVQDSVETLDVSLKGFEGWYDEYVSDWNGDHGLAVRESWTAELEIELRYLITVMRQSRKLRILRIQATSELHPLFPFLERRDYLCVYTAIAFLSAASNLTSLELDLCGTGLRPYYSPGGPHVCMVIAVLLTKLRHLRLRMRSICADVLKPPRRYANLRLNEMLINLSLSNESPVITSAAYATCCGSSSSTGGFLRLKADLEKEAQVFVTHMVAPKMVRILTHALPTMEMRAFDVLTGRNLKLSEGAEWDDDGEVIEDPAVSDAESEISDLSSDDYDAGEDAE
ncbi:hypothetical protein QBC44DRAFT_97930 [Cladorrhinum sp. PSN332]|nr:hypothetical protein QBC44DRAFT_97930 [Cladorrhinum sp. PSN332]